MLKIIYINIDSIPVPKNKEIDIAIEISELYDSFK